MFSKSSFAVKAAVGITGFDHECFGLLHEAKQLAYENGAFVSKEKAAFAALSPTSVDAPAKNDKFGYVFRESCTLAVNYDAGKKDDKGRLKPSCFALQCATRKERATLARSLKRIFDEGGNLDVGGDVPSLRHKRDLWRKYKDDAAWRSATPGAGAPWPKSQAALNRK